MTSDGMAAEPALAVSAVARRLGVSPSTLRTWDRRYGLGPSGHPAGTHRRYGARDLQRLELMRRLVAEGAPPAEAARVALDDSAVVEPDKAAGGGRVLALPGAEDVVRGLARAAMALDGEAVMSTVLAHLEQHGVLATWDRVLVPVLVAAGARWETTGEGVEVEHLLSHSIAAALNRFGESAPQPPRPVLLACAPEDQHVLPLYAVSAALAETGRGSKLLGAAVPKEALHAAVRRTSPSVVVVWSQRPETADLGVLELPVTRPATQVLVGGPGWPERLPTQVGRVHGLGAAVDLVGRALSGEPIASTA